MKFLLFIFNFIIALCGLGLIVTGCLIHFGLANWIPINEVAAVLQNEFLRSATYMIIGAGALVFLIAICGCLGAVMENRCLLVLYFLFLLVIFAAQLAAGILAAIYSDQITGFLQTEGVEFLAMDYGNNTDKVAKAATKGWDVIQDELECCGVTGQNDYSENPNLGAANAYPDSCCAEKVKDDMDNNVCSTTNPQAYTEGCEDNIKNLIVQYSTIIGASAVGVACFELFCMLFAICICRNIGDED